MGFSPSEMSCWALSHIQEWVDIFTICSFKMSRFIIRYPDIFLMFSLYLNLKELCPRLSSLDFLYLKIGIRLTTNFVIYVPVKLLNMVNKNLGTAVQCAVSLTSSLWKEMLNAITNAA